MSIDEADVEVVRHLPAVVDRASVLLAPVMDKNTALKRLHEFQEFVGTYLTESQDGGNDGGDYGVIPGTKKKTLLKSGADKLCELYGLADEYDIKATVDWDSGLFDYEVKCILKSRRDDSVVGTGVGSCSSFESKYRWREQKRKCPDCGMEGIIKGKEQYGGGWLCWKKQGGCGATFKDGDKKIEGQVIGRVENPDIVDIKNTVLKMAKKRAKIDATIGATRSSGIFSQDWDEVAPTLPVDQPDEVTTEAKTYTRPKVQEPSAPAASPTEMCSKEMQDWLRLQFKEALPVKYQADADKLRRDFLKDMGFADDKGNGTSKKIPAVVFKTVAAKCLNHAKTIAELDKK